MFHQVSYSIDADFFRVENNCNFSFPAHAHGCFEVLFVTSGEMEVEVANKKRTLKQNDAAFIFPNQIHSLKTPDNLTSSHTLCIFSNSLVRHFYNEHRKSIPKDNFYKVPPSIIDQIKKLEFEKNKSVIKGSLYLVCGEFQKTTEFLTLGAPNTAEQSEGENSLMSQIFLFIENNSRGDCTLNKLALNLPYSYVHLSRFFKQTCGISFNEYVNRYRISEACYLLKNTDKSILDIALECGYTSVRSFNRNFKEIVKMTPLKYRVFTDEQIFIS